MNPHAGDTTQNQRNRVYPYAGNGLTTRGTVEVAPIWWVFVSAVGALMPFMLATRPHKRARGFPIGAGRHTRNEAGAGQQTNAHHAPRPHTNTQRPRAAQTHSLRGPGSSSNDAAQSLTA